MSRYVNLDGNTWDGTPITSKILEMKTEWGCAQGITVGWLFGDNVPHIDLEEHDKEVIQNYINNVVEELEELAKQEDTPKYEGDVEFDLLVGVSDVIKIVKRGCADK